jgi:hypothetical protein
MRPVRRAELTIFMCREHQPPGTLRTRPGLYRRLLCLFPVIYVTHWGGEEKISFRISSLSRFEPRRYGVTPSRYFNMKVGLPDHSSSDGNFVQAVSVNGCFLLDVKSKKTRQTMYVQRKIDMRSCNQRCSKKAISTIYSECQLQPSLSSINAHALYCYLRPLRLYHNFPHYLTNGRIIEKKYCIYFFLFLYNFCLKHFSF